jgi:hypothetical protein
MSVEKIWLSLQSTTCKPWLMAEAALATFQAADSKRQDDCYASGVTAALPLVTGKLRSVAIVTLRFWRRCEECWLDTRPNIPED